MVHYYSRELIDRSGYEGADFAEHYDAHRPRTPETLLDILCVLAQAERPRLVVDLGSGTGLSTRAWADRAKEVVGVEPSGMRRRAEAETTTANVRYVEGWAQATGLPDGCADVVTCSQSLHWMEPEPTFAEVARILRRGGVFAAYDYDWPPVFNWEVEAAFLEMFDTVGRLRQARGMPRGRWRKAEHLARMRASGRFRFAREIVLHASEEGTVERLIGFALSLGPLVVLLNEGVSEEEVGLANLREVAARVLGDRTVTWYFCYRARLAVK